VFVYYLIFCFIATVSFAVVFNVPRSEFWTCGLIGTLGWSVGFVFRDGAIFFGIFLAACCVALLSRLFALFRRCPLTLYMVPGIIPLVPGGAIYTTMYAIISGEQTSAAMVGINTLQTAGSICLGILAVLALPGSVFERIKIFSRL